MFLVGLTGGIATGKSTVSKIMTEEGVPVVDADLIARQVVEPGKPAWLAIKNKFGLEVLTESGSIDRAKLGQLIFNNEAKRTELNKITHPAIYREMLSRCFNLMIQGHQFAVLDLPLLYESNYMTRFLHKIVVVRCSAEQQLNRLMERNTFTIEEAQSRIDSQMNLNEKCRRANYVINNGLSVEETRKQVKDILAELRSSWLHWVYRMALLGVIVAIPALLFLLYEYFYL
ncbi:Dephospho-CoA kinase domain-containing protein [Halotydeus destructor]|nr:Dephospho-CoA kinase domain-containing protein [Halotydeus destructor]